MTAAIGLPVTGVTAAIGLPVTGVYDPKGAAGGGSRPSGGLGSAGRALSPEGAT